MKSISWDFWEDQGEIMHGRDQCRPCWPGVSGIGHRAGTGFPEYSTKWEEDATTFDHMLRLLSLDQFSSVAQSCPTLCNPMNRSMPGLPVHKYVCVHIYIYIYIYVYIYIYIYIYMYSYLENFMDRKAWQTTVPGVTNSGTWLSK